MPSLKDIRTRIDATKNTQQITKAMKLVAAAKLRKAQNQIMGMRPYAHGLVNIINHLAKSENVVHPFLKGHAQNQENTNNLLLVVFTSDRGLCGGFNAQVIKAADLFLKENKEQFAKVDIIFIGKKAADFFARRKVFGIETINRLDRDISYNLAKRVALQILDSYSASNYQQVKFIYNEFKSAISQKVVCEQILPVLGDMQSNEVVNLNQVKMADFVFEPKVEVILDDLLYKHFIMQTYRCMCESVAAEHGARMTAMENATNNSKEVINKLTLTYNKIRQEKITTELTEIVSGAEAL